MKNRIFVALILCIVCFLIFTACETTYRFSCPYEISNPHVEIGESNGDYNFAGMHFSVFNDSSKTVSGFTISFLLYDSEGNNPFIGSNCIVSKCEIEIDGGQISDFVINLDPYISLVPDEPFIVDFIYLREIHYIDGTSWKDPYGMYCIRESHE